MATGRPTKFDAALGAKIVEKIKNNVPLNAAAAAHGIDYTTLHRWIEAGKKGRSPYREFADAVGRAQGECVSKAVLEITKASRDDWKALAWLLERRFPKEWGQRVKVEVEQELERFLDLCKQRLPTDVYRQVLQVATELSGGETSTST